MRPRGPVEEDASGLPNLAHVRLFYANQSTELLQALEAWRISAQGWPPQQHLQLVRRWMQLLASTSQGVTSLDSFLTSHPELLSQESAHLRELKEIIAVQRSDTSRYKAACDALRIWRAANGTPNTTLPRKIVCFASDITDAQALSDFLLREIGYGDVITAFAPGAGATAEIATSFAADKQAWILICDRSAEEGLSLQFVHAILHMDLPFSPTRLEQRIGRVDRFGRRIDKVGHIVMLPSDDEDSPW
jgi:ATP-dependent helicase HepA